MIANREAMFKKIALLPELLIQEVSDVVDFLLTKKNSSSSCYAAPYIAESSVLSESDMSDYLVNLEVYEDQLAQGKIRW